VIAAHLDDVVDRSLGVLGSQPHAAPVPAPARARPGTCRAPAAGSGAPHRDRTRVGVRHCRSGRTDGGRAS
jgi:hypothetical protein